MIAEANCWTAADFKMVARWNTCDIIADNIGRREQGASCHGCVNASFVAVIVWKNTGIGVQLSLPVISMEKYELKIHYGFAFQYYILTLVL
jgi:hypothetical protein